MKTFLVHLLTGIDNRTVDIARVLGLMFGAQFLVLAAWAVIVNKQPFGPVEYGTGAGAVLTAVGVAIALKSKTEPNATR